ncbi:Fc.00g043050.m01.CDS01 [Cosmosporella sp. VM-42]
MAYGSVDSSAETVERLDTTAHSSQDQIDVLSTEETCPAQADSSGVQQQDTWRKCKNFYERNFGLFLVLMAQVFGSLMTMSTRLLETSFDTKFHALQIIFVRMSATSVFALLYMWYQKVPGAPFGDRSIRGLLVLRGMAGFIGLFGAYYSLSYLNISDATVISFLTPILTAFLCFVALREPFTVKEGLAGIIALAGVLLIARPTFLFPGRDIEGTSTLLTDTPQDGLVPTVPVTPAERSIAVLSAMLGAFGAATAYSTIRVIGKRAHSLVSVNYFAMLATIGSCLTIVIHPKLQFQLPRGALQWTLLTAIGLTGFMLQFLLTEGLQREKGGRATNLIYTQLVFALILERIVWGTTPSQWSLAGGILIIGAAIWSSLQKNKTVTKVEGLRTTDEESSLLANDQRNALR